MGYVVLTEYEARPGAQDRLRTALEALLEPSADEPGWVALTVYADPNRPERMALVEEWESPLHARLHRAGAHRRHAERVLPDVLAGARAVRTLEWSAPSPR
ncbi:putative quinol monooxygenase [Streptomyces sp. NPDC057411]|uniref:putative quinol monooxygenase n=1 Tax=unclassified Streptomyces TaxID=2593676 RepID=UPI00363CAE00